MNRYWLVPYTSAGSAQKEGDGTGWVSWKRPIARVLQSLGIAIRVHEILRSDTGRDPHNHPWPYITVILRGRYCESRYDDTGYLVSSKWHGPGSVLIRSAKDLHRLYLSPHTTVTTLFMTGRYRQKWGFRTHDGFVPHNEYFKGRSQ
jgi:hypothetical protein